MFYLNIFSIFSSFFSFVGSFLLLLLLFFLLFSLFLGGRSVSGLLSGSSFLLLLRDGRKLVLEHRFDLVGVGLGGESDDNECGSGGFLHL